MFFFFRRKTFSHLGHQVKDHDCEEMIQEVNRNHVDIVFNTATKIYKNKIEVRINPDNKIIMTGMGNFNELAELVR